MPSRIALAICASVQLPMPVSLSGVMFEATAWRVAVAAAGDRLDEIAPALDRRLGARGGGAERECGGGQRE
jgi:hypothetical protein